MFLFSSTLFFVFCQSTDANVDDDACLNVNCNYGQCLIAAHDGKAYCRCLTGYTGEQCLDIESENAREISRWKIRFNFDWVEHGFPILIDRFSIEVRIQKSLAFLSYLISHVMVPASRLT